MSLKTSRMKISDTTSNWLAEVRHETEEIGDFWGGKRDNRFLCNGAVSKVDVVQTYPLEARVELMQTRRGCSYGRINGARTAKRTPTGRWWRRYEPAPVRGRERCAIWGS